MCTQIDRFVSNTLSLEGLHIPLHVRYLSIFMQYVKSKAYLGQANLNQT